MYSPEIFLEAKNRKWARMIFEQMAQFEGNRGNFRIKQNSPVSEWGLDKAYYLNKDKSLVVVLKDRRVYLLENSLGFSHDYVINVSKRLWED